MDGRPQPIYYWKRPSLLHSTMPKWEKWQLKSNASVYCQRLEPLFTLPTIITHVILTGILPVAHQSDAVLGDSLERPWRLLLKASGVTSVNLDLIQMKCVHLASRISRPQGWPQWWLNSSCSESMTSVILPPVLQGLFAVLIKDTDWWLGTKSGCVWVFSAHATLFNLRGTFVFLGRPEGQPRRSLNPVAVSTCAPDPVTLTIVMTLWVNSWGVFQREEMRKSGEEDDTVRLWLCNTLQILLFHVSQSNLLPTFSFWWDCCKLLRLHWRGEGTALSLSHTLPPVLILMLCFCNP